MKKTSLLAALAFALLPTLASAQGCHGDKKEISASSCKDGHTWDETRGMCVLQPSS